MKKVLIITYYWPPAGGPGVQRVLKYSRYLPEFGWQPVILTVENPSSPAKDSSLLEKIHEKCIIYKTKTLEPFAAYKSFTGKSKDASIPKDVIAKKEKSSLKENAALWIRANIFVPDARIGWIPYLVKQGKEIIEKEKPEIIFSTSPPHSLQIGARRLAKLSKLKWVADFRDPWNEAYWERDIGKSGPARRLNMYFEKKTLQEAHFVTTVSEGYYQMFGRKHKTDYALLHSGFEDINTDVVQTDRFSIIFIGNLSKYQSPMPFLEALKTLPENIRSAIDIYFIGKVFDDYKDALLKAGIILKDYIPYKELMTFLKSASLFLLLIHETEYTVGYLPVKIYDYLSLRKPILAIGERNSIADQVLQKTESGSLFEKNELQNIADFIKKHFEQWQKDKSVLLAVNDNLMQYSTKQNVKELATIFNKLTRE